MLTIIRIFFQARGPNPLLVLTCLLLSSIAGGLGIASLLPLLSLLSAGDDDKYGSVAHSIKDALAFFGIQPDLTSLLLLIFGCILVKGILTFVAMRHVGYAAARVSTDIRTRLIEQVLHVRWKFLTSQPTSRLLHAIGGEAGLAGNTYALAAGFLANLLQAMVSIVLSIIISWKLACVAIVFGIIIAAALHFLVRMAKRAGTRQNDRLRELVVYLLDALNNIKPIKAMARQTEFFRHLEGKLLKIRAALQKQTVSQEARRSLEEIMLTASLCAAFYVSVAILQYDVSKLIVMGLLLMQTMRNVGKIQESLQKAVVLEAPYRSVERLTRELREAREEAGGVAPPEVVVCRMENVTFGYGDALILDGVDFEIVRGRITALTGPSGAGKSTITDLMLRFYRPQGGHILVDGMSLDGIDLQAWRKLIGYVPQDLMLLHDTILANLVLGDAEVSESDVREALEVAGAWQFVSERPQGLQTVVGEKGLHLSGGQRQRIALARALIRRPRILILDEVSSALDPETELDICRRLQAMSQQMAILVITHRPAFLEIAQRIYELENGSLVARNAALNAG